ncbi:hypothetical protein WKV44_09425 [Spirochaetia bacterium 38H-sp]|uniref:DUF1254 domain-containing protein n=1 Tax=Rarispira pelagica TaxID=3141764 RepID=A0ABU9UDK5_9SPIR
MNIFSKKKLLVLLILVSATSILFAFELSSLYVKTVYVSKVYTYDQGYKVLYVKQNLDIGTAYIPLKWVKEKKAIIVPGNDPLYPYMSIYWKEGQFYRVILYIPDDPRNPAWGFTSKTDQEADKFEIDTLEMEF